MPSRFRTRFLSLTRSAGSGGPCRSTLTHAAEPTGPVSKSGTDSMPPLSKQTGLYPAPTGTSANVPDGTTN